jgi:phage replication-related protein YjqB (UPF0714/DUF867 family)
MADKYSSFSHLASSEASWSFKIELCQRESAVAFMALHGGKIELGTSEITKAIARDDLSYYLFEGCKRVHNSDLHIASSKFDEPNAIELATTSQVIFAIHGQYGSDVFVNVGGLAERLLESLITYLTKYGFKANRNGYYMIGSPQENICNRGLAGSGIQLKLSHGLRQKLLSEIDEMDKFTDIIRAACREQALI